MYSNKERIPCVKANIKMTAWKGLYSAMPLETPEKHCLKQTDFLNTH